MMVVLLILLIFCAVNAIKATQVLNATIWLAGVSTLVAGFLYYLGAWQIAVIELSVGTGLVTVLMVFAMTMVGNEAERYVQQRLPLLLVIASILLLILLSVPLLPNPESNIEPVQGDILWQARSLDLLLQVVLIFAGVLGVIGLLATKQVAKNSTSEIQLPDSKNDQLASALKKDAA